MVGRGIGSSHQSDAQHISSSILVVTCFSLHLMGQKHTDVRPFSLRRVSCSFFARVGVASKSMAVAVSDKVTPGPDTKPTSPVEPIGLASV